MIINPHHDYLCLCIQKGRSQGQVAIPSWVTQFAEFMWLTANQAQAIR
jgi:hypothetical protein